MTKWEYAMLRFTPGMAAERKVVFTDGSSWEPIKDSDLLATLGRLGQAGWELVSVAVNLSGQPNLYYFKRPQPDSMG